MSRYQLHLHTRALVGQEEAYHRWYDEIHIAEMLGLDGFLTGERFAPVPLAPDAPTPETYLAIYEVETDDVGALLAQLNSAKMEISPALDTNSVRMELYRTITPKIAS